MPPRLHAPPAAFRPARPPTRRGAGALAARIGVIGLGCLVGAATVAALSPRGLNERVGEIVVSLTGSTPAPAPPASEASAALVPPTGTAAPTLATAPALDTPIAPPDRLAPGGPDASPAAGSSPGPPRLVPPSPRSAPPDIATGNAVPAPPGTAGGEPRAPRRPSEATADVAGPIPVAIAPGVELPLDLAPPPPGAEAPEGLRIASLPSRAASGGAMARLPVPSVPAAETAALVTAPAAVPVEVTAPAAVPVEVAAASADEADPPAAAVAARAARVIVHYPADAAVAAGAAVAALTGAGITEATSIEAAFDVGRSNVRYYHAEDAEAAQEVAALLAGPADEAPDARDFTDFRPSPAVGMIEVWLAGNAPEAPRRPTAPAVAAAPRPAAQSPDQSAARRAAAEEAERQRLQRAVETMLREQLGRR